VVEVSSPASPWAWRALSLWVVAGLLLALAAVVALPMGFESSAADRVEAVRQLRPTVLVLVIGGVGAAVGGVVCLRRAPRRAMV